MTSLKKPAKKAASKKPTRQPLTEEAWRYLTTNAAGPGAFAYRFFIRMETLRSISEKLKRSLTLDEVKGLFKAGSQQTCAACGQEFTETIFAVLSTKKNGKKLADFIVGWRGQSFFTPQGAVSFCGRLYGINSQGREYYDGRSHLGAAIIAGKRKSQYFHSLSRQDAEKEYLRRKEEKLKRQREGATIEDILAGKPGALEKIKALKDEGKRGKRRSPAKRK